MKGVEERSGELVVACGDGAVDLDVADHAFDMAPFLVETAVPADGRLAVRARRNNRANTIGPERGADRVAVVALVGDEMARACIGQPHHGLECRAVGRLAAGEMEGEREAAGITETMNFTGEPAPRAAKSLFASPPFAPAAETWP